MLDDKGFDRWADDYDLDVRQTEEANGYPFAGYTDVLRTIHSAARSANARSVLDVGFGTGALTRRFYGDGLDVTGIDFSEKMVGTAKEKMPGANLIRHDIADGLPDALAGRTFDAIVATYALHHLGEAAHAAFVRRLFSRLTPGGILLIGDVSFETETERDACRAAAGGGWDDAEFYFAFDAHRRRIGLPCAFRKLSGCAGVLTLRKPRFVMFDYGGTLAKEFAFDSLRGTEALMRHMTRNDDGLTAAQINAFELSHFLSLDTVRQERLVEVHEQLFLRFVCESLGIDFSLSPADHESLFWDGCERAAAMDGAPELLSALRAQRIRTGVVSNISFSGEALKRRLNRLFPEHAFDFVIASSEYVFRKPSPQIFRLALRKAGLPPDECWFLGNHRECDVGGAAGAGIAPVWLVPEEKAADERADCAVIRRLETLAEAFA